MMEFEFKETYSIEDLVEIVRILRAPGGCPWDQEQDHHSIRKNMLEEAYEAAEAIDLDDPDLLKEELGDVLLQVALHAQMEREAGRFDFNDVCDGVAKKLIERHPHVFGNVAVSGTGEALKNWEAIKQRSKGQNTAADTLEAVPKTFPALMRAEKVQHRGAKAGMKHPDVRWAMNDLRSEVEELQEALDRGNAADQADELGDVLFSAVNVARFAGADPERALNGAVDRFIRRVAAAERIAGENGRTLAECSVEELDAFWKAAKKELEAS